MGEGWGEGGQNGGQPSLEGLEITDRGFQPWVWGFRIGPRFEWGPDRAPVLVHPLPLGEGRVREAGMGSRASPHGMRQVKDDEIPALNQHRVLCRQNLLQLRLKVIFGKIRD